MNEFGTLEQFPFHPSIDELYEKEVDELYGQVRHEILGQDLPLPEITTKAQLDQLSNDRSNVYYALLVYNPSKPYQEIENVLAGLPHTDRDQIKYPMKTMKVSSTLFEDLQQQDHAVVILYQGEVVDVIDTNINNLTLNEVGGDLEAILSLHMQEQEKRKRIYGGVRDPQEKNIYGKPSTSVTSKEHRISGSSPQEKNIYGTRQKESPITSGISNEKSIYAGKSTSPVTAAKTETTPIETLEHSDVTLKEQVTVIGSPERISAKFSSPEQNIIMLHDGKGHYASISLRASFPETYTLGNRSSGKLVLNGIQYRFEIVNTNGLLEVTLTVETATGSGVGLGRKKESLPVSPNIVNAESAGLTWFEYGKIRAYEKKVLGSRRNASLGSQLPDGFQIEYGKSGLLFKIEKDNASFWFRDRTDVVVNLSTMSSGIRKTVKVNGNDLGVMFELDGNGLLRCYLEPSQGLIDYRKKPKLNLPKVERSDPSPEPSPVPVPSGPDMSTTETLNAGNYPKLEGKDVTSFYTVVGGVPSKTFGQVQIDVEYNTAKKEYVFTMRDKHKMRLFNRITTLHGSALGTKSYLKGTIQGHGNHEGWITAKWENGHVRFYRGDEKLPSGPTIRSSYENDETYGGSPPQLRYPLSKQGTLTTHINAKNPDGSTVRNADFTYPKRYRTHTGIDIDGSMGEPIFAAAAGTVVYVENSIEDNGIGNFTRNDRIKRRVAGTGKGNVIVIQHANDTYTLYSHNKQGSAKVSVGATVTAGQEIAEVGNSGRVMTSDKKALATHLHLEYFRFLGTPTASDFMSKYYDKSGVGFQRLDPEAFLPGGDGTMKIAGTSKKAPESKPWRPVIEPMSPESAESVRAGTWRYAINTQGGLIVELADGRAPLRGEQITIQKDRFTSDATKQLAVGYYQATIYGTDRKFRVSDTGPEGRVVATEAVGSDIKQVGEASFYGEGDKFDGKRTAFGEIFNKNELTAAHRRLPHNTMLEVFCPETQKKVVVRVNDRGPYVKAQDANNKEGLGQNRVIDLSFAAAQQLGIDKMGRAKVEIKILPPETT